MQIKQILNDWVYPIVIAIVLAILINKFVFFNITVPSESMVPTIKVGDRMIVTRVYNPQKLKRGSIVVFHSDELQEDLVKRLIGLPGDKVDVKEDGVYVNNEKISQPYVAYDGGKLGSFKVPENEYFFLGDNRANSFDSRSWKDPYISANKIKGKTVFRVYPFNRMGKLK